jgi:tetratricopeptide (TPR) repeat protein
MIRRVAMKDMINPYIAGAPVTEARMFFGRDDVFEWITHNLAGQYADHILVIHGQRRVGKTSVLKQLSKHLPKRYIPIFFDLQGRTSTTLDRFLWWLAREIARVLKQDRGLEIAVPDKQAFESDPEYFENHFLPAVFAYIRKNSLLLTFDEFDNLERMDKDQGLARPLIDYLRRLMGLKGLNFIFSIGSSGRKLENMQAAYTEFFKTALYKKISFLNEEECRRLITEPAQSVLEFEPDAIASIYHITSGHPYFTQLLCHELFSVFQKTGQITIRKEDVEAILDDTIERGTVNLKFVWDEAAELEKWILAALVRMEGPIDQQALGDFLHRQKVRFIDTDLGSALVRLRDKDILTEDNRFVIYLLKIWVRKNRSLEQVREELVEVNPIANRYIEIGLEYRDSGLPAKAIDSFREALRVSPDNIQAQVNIGMVRLEQGKYEWAVQEFEKARKIDDEDVSVRTGLCAANLALGDQAVTRGEGEAAVEFYQRVLEINAEHTEARQHLAEIYLRKAEEAYTRGEEEVAVRNFEQATQSVPEDPRLAHRLIEVKEEIQKNHRDKQLQALLQLANTSLLPPKKQWEKVMARQSKTSMQQLAYGKFQAGEALLEMGHTEKAVSEFAEAYQFEPELTRSRYALALLQIAVNRERSGDIAPALESYKAAGKLLPGGELLEKLGQIIKAVAELTPSLVEINKPKESLIAPSEPIVSHLEGTPQQEERKRAEGIHLPKPGEHESVIIKTIRILSSIDFHSAWRWLILSFSGLFLGIGFAFVLGVIGLDSQSEIIFFVSIILAFSLPGTLIGLFQWMRLRHFIEHSAWWIGLSALTWLIGLGIGFGFRLVPFSFTQGPSLSDVERFLLMFIIVAFATGVSVGTGQYLYIKKKKSPVKPWWIGYTVLVHILTILPISFTMKDPSTWGIIFGILLGVLIYSFLTALGFSRLEPFKERTEKEEMHRAEGLPAGKSAPAGVRGRQN